MKNKNSKARTQVIFGALLFALVLIAELYVMINMADQVLLVIGFAMLGLICVYVMINGFFEMGKQKEQRSEEQYENLFKSEKASYLLLKRNFEEIEDKLNYLEQAAKVPTEEIVNAQKGIAKVIINRSHENTEALISSNDLVTEKIGGISEQLNELTRSIDENKGAVAANREALTAMISSEKDAILEGQKGISSSSDKAIEMRKQDIIVNLKDMELRLNTAIMQLQKVMAQTPVMAAPVQMMQTPVQMTQEPVPSAYTAPIENHADIHTVMEEAKTSLNAALDELPNMEMNPEELPAAGSVLEVEEPAAELMPELASEPEPAAEPMLELVTEPEPVVESMPELVSEPELVAEPEPMPESVSEPELMAEPEPVVEEKPPMPDLSDPNKQMSADDIAALFANMSAEPAAEPEPEPIVEEKPPMPDLSDPNKQMSADDIAALFANMSAEPVPEPEPIVEEKPPMPDLSDPNKQMSADDIAALFANMGA